MRKPDDYLELLVKDADPYISNLQKGFQSTEKKLSTSLTIKNMGKYLVRNMRNYIFWGKFFLPFITSGSLWIPYYPFNAFNSEAKVFFLFCMSVSAVLYWRRETLKIMTIPGNEFFNLGAFEKYRKEEFEAFINLSNDQFLIPLSKN
ncbi:hypothetical protein ACQCVE_08325 [Metabacillus sp. 113a]|uniref:hypothetical protein n=1 Tax=Metabacillus sp. 113a TaxID=3404706 RepID=UPI003CF21D33